MAISDNDIRRIWVHTHPQDPDTDMRGYMLSTYRKLVDVEAKVDALTEKLGHTHALVEQINRVIVLGGTPNGSSDA